MDKQELTAFIDRHSLAVQCSVASNSAPQGAVVGIVHGAGFEIFFDTVDSTRKCVNLRQNNQIALTLGGLLDEDPRTVQLNGISDQPKGEELANFKQKYFARFPEGKQRELWKGICYFRVKPVWIRYSDYSQDPPLIVEFDF